MKKILFTVTLCISVVNKIYLHEKIIEPRPTEAEIAHTKTVIGKALKIPIEIRGVWTTKKIKFNEEFIIESYEICEDILSKRTYIRLDDDKIKFEVSDFNLLTGNMPERDKGGYYRYLVFRSIIIPGKKDDNPGGASVLFYYPGTKKMMYKHYIDGELLFSREYFYSKCPAEKN